ncbi:MAG: TlpA family protein disulfide reductase [Tannerellaceae bacterium]|nr:TlpA family protein disulfide reductase [Tannerellaceae bacterium]
MKTNLFLFLTFLCIGTIAANERIIERPAFSAWSTQTIEIDKIVLTDTETVLYVDAYFTPNWWIKIASGTFIRANGKEYPVQSANGITLDEEIYMPESGTLSFQLVFPAIPEDIKEMDFIEGYDPGAFCLWGIRLDGEFPSVEMPAIPTEKTILPPSRIDNRPATIHVNIVGYKPGMNLSGTIHHFNTLLGSVEELSAEISSEGKLVLEIPLLHATAVYFNTPYFNERMYLLPGEESTLTINLTEKIRTESRYLQDKGTAGEIYQFTGAMAGLNKEVLNTSFDVYLYAQTYEEHIEMLTHISVMDAGQYKAYFMDRYNNKIKELDELNISDPLRTLLLQDAKIHLAEVLLGGKSMIEFAYRQINQLEQEAVLPEAVASGFTGDYYTFLPELLPGDETALYSRSYTSLIQGIYFHMNGQGKDFPSLTKLLGTDKGMLFDCIKLVEFFTPINNMMPLTETQLAELGKLYPEVLPYLEKKSKEVEKIIAENKRTTPYDLEKVNIEDIPEEEVFASITSPYRGKVIFVDFWATWCGPCIQAMKVSEPVKEEFMGKDVVFLYLAGDNSPKDKWDEMMPGIKGIHHRVTGSQWDYWWKRFNMNGVPSYMVIGKDGNPVHFQAGFMGVDRMRELLNTELEK